VPLEPNRARNGRKLTTAPREAVGRKETSPPPPRSLLPSRIVRAARAPRPGRGTLGVRAVARFVARISHNLFAGWGTRSPPRAFHRQWASTGNTPGKEPPTENPTATSSLSSRTHGPPDRSVRSPFCLCNERFLASKVFVVERGMNSVRHAFSDQRDGTTSLPFEANPHEPRSTDRTNQASRNLPNDPRTGQATGLRPVRLLSPHGLESLLSSSGE
jgi:hypothetical protein